VVSIVGRSFKPVRPGQLLPERLECSRDPHMNATAARIRVRSLNRMNRRVFPLFGAISIAVMVSLTATTTADAHRTPRFRTQSATSATAPASAKKILKKVTKAKRRLKTVPKGRPTLTTPSTTVAAATTVVTAPPASLLPLDGTASSGSTVPVPVPAGDLSATTLVPAATTTTKAPTTTLPPAPFPAPANPAIRATANGMEPYKGLGAWVDRFDWTTQWSGKATPPVNWTTMDQMAAAGVETVYIQAAHWAGQVDVLEPDKLIPMINRAHELGMYVVVWYVPAVQDVNTDLRKTVALANLEVDGIAIDVENYTTVPEINERNRRHIAYSAALRQLLAGRFITINVVEPTSVDAVANLWTQPNGAPPKTVNSFWRGPFPYKELAPYYDLWTIQTYWTNRAVDSGWRDGYRYVAENVKRLRTNLGRDDVPIHVTGGVGDKVKVLNDLSGFQQAARELNVVGISFYDWVVWPRAWWSYSWGFRKGAREGTIDPRFAPVEPPSYVQTVQPPITTTTKPGAVPVVPAVAIPSTVPETVVAIPPVTIPATSPTTLATVPPNSIAVS
jgi:hypothetical protein